MKPFCVYAGLTAAIILTICFPCKIKAGEDLTPVSVREGLSGWNLSSSGLPVGSMEYVDHGVLKVTGDFSRARNGNYITVGRKVPQSEFYQELRFKVKSPATRLAVRFGEVNGQAHQFFLRLTGNPEEIQELRVPVTGSPGSHWGGPNDGKMSSALARISFALHTADCAGKDKFSSEFFDIYLTDRENAPRQIGFKPVTIENMFVPPEWKGDIALRLSKKLGSDSKSDLNYVYCDYEGKEVISGTADYDRENDVLSLPPPRKTGTYDLRFPALGITAGVVVSAPFSGEPDGYFAIDSGFSWGDKSDPGKIYSYLKILKYIGVGWNRDRLSWHALNPGAGEFFLKPGKKGYLFDTYRRMAAEVGIKTLDTFHDTPGWNRYGSEKTKISIDWKNPRRWGVSFYPWNLQDAADSFLVFTTYWNDTVKALEVWNEPNGPFGNDFPGEYQSAFTKAISYRLARARSDVQVIGGAFAGNPSEALYRLIIANGTLDDVDAISFHSYSSYAEDEDRMIQMRESQVARLREIEASSGSSRLGIPLWMTEGGSPWRKKDSTGRPTIAEARRSAADIVFSFVEFRALGIARHFLYVFDYYNEGKNNFGHMDANHTPLRSMGAYANLVHQLAHREYIGDLKIEGVLRSRVFAADGKAVAVLCNGLVGEKPDFVTLPADLEIEGVSGIDGRPLTVVDGKVPMRDGVAYVHIREKNIQQYLLTDTRALKLYRIAKNFPGTQRKALPIVFQPADELQGKAYNCDGFTVRPDTVFPISILINNMSNRELTIDPVLRLPENMAAVKFSNGKIVVPPYGRIPFSFAVSLSREMPLNRFALVRLEDRCGNATPIAWSFRRSDQCEIFAAPLEQNNRNSEGADWMPMTDWRTVGTFAAPKNIDARFKVGYTADLLQIQVLVRDKEFFCDYPAGATWNGDSVQVAFQKEGGDYLEYAAAKSRDGFTVYRHSPPAGMSKARVKLQDVSPGEKLYIIDIPKGEFGIASFRAGMKFSFSILVNNNNGTGREGYLLWDGNIASSKNPAEFNQLILK